jgi:Uma2 family endonuclease
MRGISWETYERLLREVGDDHPGLHLTYDDGLLEIFMPGKKHEKVKTIVARLLEAYSDEVGIDAEDLGSMTFKQKKKKKGLEPDECYYVQNIAKVAEMQDEFDPAKDSPPDLAIEVDITSSSISRQSIYAVLGVPEIWRYDGERIAPFLRQRSGSYVKVAKSAAFPKLDFAQLNRCLAIGLAETQPAAIRALRQWLRSQQ